MSKYLKAIVPGLILLFGHGTHLIWALNQMPYNPDDVRFDGNVYTLRDIMILVYYIGGILGALIGAGLVSTFQKQIIYVSVCT